MFLTVNAVLKLLFYQLTCHLDVAGCHKNSLKL